MSRPNPQLLAQRAAGARPAAVPAASGEPATVAAPPRTPTTGAGSLVKSLEALGVKVAFGIPGGAILPAYDPLFDSSIRHILVRHEQGAGHAATGYAQVTGEVGVCMATSGPGATNLVTPLADANMDSVPIVAITGQVPRGAIGSDAFQEADIYGITLPITKHNYLVQRPEDIPRVMAEAFHLATSGRPGPVLVDIPKDVLQAPTTFGWPPVMELPGYRPTLHPHGKQIVAAARMLTSASRPILYVGGGVLKAGATAGLRKLAELTGAPVTTTLMARGAFPDSHRQHLGMPGMHGTVAAVCGLQKADLIVALGARFDDRVTGRLDSFAPGAAVVHADIDPAEIGKNRAADVPIVGDAKYVIDELIAAVEAEQAARGKPDLSAWWRYLDDLRARYPLGWEEQSDGTLAPQYVIKRLGEISGPETIWTAGVGQHQMWASQFISHENPGTWLNSGGLGTMGYAVPAAMGARWAGRTPRSGRSTVTVLPDDQSGAGHLRPGGHPDQGRGDQQRQPGHGAAWQTLFDERYSNTDLGTHKHRVPDFVKLAEALGCIGLRCETAADVDKTIEAAMAINDAPVVVDFVVGKDAMVWPMVPAGTSNDEIMSARGERPIFDDDPL